MTTNLLELVKQARSFRRYKEAEPIPPEVVRGLVDLARFVPSAGNQQPLRYRLATGPEDCAKVFPHTKWAGALKDWGGPKPGERPTGYVLILADKTKNVATDVGIAAQTIQLAATAAGYGACMLGAIDRAGLQKDFSLPETLAVQLVIALGKPGETVVLEDLAPDASPAYWRTTDGIHHVPKRRLEDVVVK